jgi:hypothetical protein
MAIIQTVDYFDFRDAFRRMGRTNQFENLEWLYDYLEELYDSAGGNYELDVIALCCEYTEESWDDVASNYSVDLPDPDDYSDLDERGEVLSDVFDEDGYTEAKREAILDYLNDHTSVCGWDDETVMYAQF